MSTVDFIIEKYLNESKYNVTLNWKGELHNFKDIDGNSFPHVIHKCIAVLAKKLGRTPESVRREFSGKKDNIKVEKV